MESILIIGTGLAGYNLAKEIRKIDQQVELRIITADGGESYSKPMLSNALAKGKTADQLVLARAEKMAGQLGAAIQCNTTVQSIDTNAKQVHTSSGDIAYDKLVLAIGASQINPALNGNAADKVLSVNDLADYARFRLALDSATRIGIIGPGLIGCEFANDLALAGKSPVVIGPSRTPLDRLLPEPVGELVMQALNKAGIEWKLGVKATEVNKSPGGFDMGLSDGSQLTVDLVLSAVGLRPNILLAQNAGLDVNRGIVVNRYLQTSQPDIFSLGDCVEVDGLVLPFVLPLMNAARTLAKTLTGNASRIIYPVMPVVVKTPAHPIVVSPPTMGAVGHWQFELEESGARAFYRGEDETLLGFVLTGDKTSEKLALSKQLPAVLP